MHEPLDAAERLVVKAVEIHDAIIHETDAEALDVLCREAAAAIAEIVKATGTMAGRAVKQS